MRSRYEIARRRLKNRGKYLTRDRYAATLSGSRDANGPLSRVIAYKSLFSEADSYAGRRVNDGYDVERSRRYTRNGNTQKKKKKKTDGEKGKAREMSRADKQCGLIQRKISATHSYGHTLRGPLPLSRLPEVPARASRSAICQTRLKICAVGSPVIIAEAYE